MIFDWMLNLARRRGRRRQPAFADTGCSLGAGSAVPCGVNRRPFAARLKAQITQQNIAWGRAKTGLPKTVINTMFVYPRASP
ncbi:hypothetical protein PT015_08525 [Candidatus Mycobacterium wuenschmannii]|uniref:Uncharacterized protein n=1 Tax=Candidatus Mycobacterium wuenschmannii TaxID=3027808 RepID=A0ABY8W4W6_9MYCO|nr:hypothetical protein [Candidatus Mycobacterium wuenschmannii]WIM89468.1 hypothetical protein PT015_08525 [Candidatus Mycobacterium wuenschmannii]